MTTPRDKIGFEHDGIGTILAHNRLAVPVNQREYSWEEEHVRDLLSDFTEAIAANKSTYFLGTIVLTNNPDSDTPEVADGQQRLATTSILLAGIRDYFYSTGDTLRSNSIEQEYLSARDLVTTDIVPKLRLNVDDNEFFSKAILSPPDHPDRNAKPTKRSHERILEAQKIAKDHIQKVVNPHKPTARAARLIEWVKFIGAAAQVIVLGVPDDVNAFMMFETLNDRGLKASQADLLKNYLLSHSGNRIREGQQRWAKMQGALEFKEEDMTVVFLHHLLISKHGPMREREVYDRVRKDVNTQSRAIEFLDELSDAAKDYAALFNPDSKKWNEYGIATRHHLTTINRDLQVEQIRPLMFAVARKFPIKEAQKAFRLFVYWSVRFLFVGGRGGVLDRLYGLRAQEVESGKVTTAAGLVTAMGEAVPSDALFEAAFAEQRVSSPRLARYYLRALELNVKEQAEPSYVPNDDNTVITLEHVLPENPGVGWAQIDEESADAYYKYLGNMVLLQFKANSTIGNASFEQKKKSLAESAYELTREIVEYPAWGIEQIRARQRRLAKVAIKTWPLTP
jgi:hypothetical protein